MVVPLPLMVGFASLNSSKFVEADAVAAVPNVKLAFVVIVGTKLPPTELLFTDIDAISDFSVYASASAFTLLSLEDRTKLREV